MLPPPLEPSLELARLDNWSPLPGESRRKNDSTQSRILGRGVDGQGGGETLVDLKRPDNIGRLPDDFAECETIQVKYCHPVSNENITEDVYLDPRDSWCSAEGVLLVTVAALNALQQRLDKEHFRQLGTTRAMDMCRRDFLRERQYLSEELRKVGERVPEVRKNVQEELETFVEEEAKLKAAELLEAEETQAQTRLRYTFSTQLSAGDAGELSYPGSPSSARSLGHSRSKRSTSHLTGSVDISDGKEAFTNDSGQMDRRGTLLNSMQKSRGVRADSVLERSRSQVTTIAELEYDDADGSLDDDERARRLREAEEQAKVLREKEEERKEILHEAAMAIAPAWPSDNDLLEHLRMAGNDPNCDQITQRVLLKEMRRAIGDVASERDRLRKILGPLDGGEGKVIEALLAAGGGASLPTIVCAVHDFVKTAESKQAVEDAATNNLRGRYKQMFELKQKLRPEVEAWMETLKYDEEDAARLMCMERELTNSEEELERGRQEYEDEVAAKFAEQRSLNLAMDEDKLLEEVAALQSPEDRQRTLDDEAYIKHAHEETQVLADELRTMERKYARYAKVLEAHGSAELDVMLTESEAQQSELRSAADEEEEQELRARDAAERAERQLFKDEIEASKLPPPSAKYMKKAESDIDRFSHHVAELSENLAERQEQEKGLEAEVQALEEVIQSRVKEKTEEEEAQAFESIPAGGMTGGSGGPASSRSLVGSMGGGLGSRPGSRSADPLDWEYADRAVFVSGDKRLGAGGSLVMDQQARQHQMDKKALESFHSEEAKLLQRMASSGILSETYPADASSLQMLMGSQVLDLPPSPEESSKKREKAEATDPQNPKRRGCAPVWFRRPEDLRVKLAGAKHAVTDTWRDVDTTNTEVTKLRDELKAHAAQFSSLFAEGSLLHNEARSGLTEALANEAECAGEVSNRRLFQVSAHRVELLDALETHQMCITDAEHAWSSAADACHRGELESELDGHAVMCQACNQDLVAAVNRLHDATQAAATRCSSIGERIDELSEVARRCCTELHSLLPRVAEASSAQLAVWPRVLWTAFALDRQRNTQDELISSLKREERRQHLLVAELDAPPEARRALAFVREALDITADAVIGRNSAGAPMGVGGSRMSFPSWTASSSTKASPRASSPRRVLITDDMDIPSVFGYQTGPAMLSSQSQPQAAVPVVAKSNDAPHTSSSSGSATRAARAVRAARGALAGTSTGHRQGYPLAGPTNANSTRLLSSGSPDTSSGRKIEHVRKDIFLTES